MADDVFSGTDPNTSFTYEPKVDWVNQVDWNKFFTDTDEGRNLLGDISALGDLGVLPTYSGNYLDTSNIFSPSNANYDPNYSSGSFDLNKILDFLKGRGGAAAAGALLSYLDKAKPSGGGYAKRYTGATPIQRKLVQGKYGPIAQYSAAPGGIANAGVANTTNTANPANTSDMSTMINEQYNDPNKNGFEGEGSSLAQGGVVSLEDGGFVLTKRAVDGAGGERGIQSIVPEAKMIRGPGTGTSDSIPAKIVDRQSGRATPAAVSNGEAYVPRHGVQRAGGARQLHALMNKLQRRG